MLYMPSIQNTYNKALHWKFATLRFAKSSELGRYVLKT